MVPWRFRMMALAVLPKGAVVLAEDETHLNLLPWDPMRSMGTQAAQGRSSPRWLVKSAGIGSGL
jgi:hypothetical protein